MDDFSDAKKTVLHCISVLTEDIVNLPNYPSEQKTDLIIKQLYEVMRQLSAMSEK